ncbi:MAG: hypothetical protein HY881_04660 [Deltaproteobacteria bacterium]|nr:hypothetical protein [Deltaproteobacteria bacterium]
MKFTVKNPSMSSTFFPPVFSETGFDSIASSHSLKVAGSLVLLTLCFSISLFGFFFADDFYNIKNALSSGWSLWKLMGGYIIDSRGFQDGWITPPLSELKMQYFRPIFLASLLIDHAVWGLRAWGYHISNIVLHLMVVSAFFGVLRELIPGKRGMALFGATLYGLMPFHAMSVAWVSGRTELLPALGMMVALWSYLRFARGGGGIFYFLSLGTASLALFSKENALVLPFIILAVWRLVLLRPRLSFGWQLPYFLITIPYLALRTKALGGFPLPISSPFYHSWNEPGFLTWAMAKATCVFYSLLLHVPMIFPIELFLVKTPWLIVPLILVACLIAGWIVMLIHAGDDNALRRTGWLAVVWVVVSVLPTAPLLVAPFYFYFPLAGITLLYLVIWNRLSERGRPLWITRSRQRKIMAVSLIAFFCIGLQAANGMFVAMSREAKRLLGQIGEQLPAGTEPIDLYLVDSPFVTGPPKAALQLFWPKHLFKLYILSPYPAKHDWDEVESMIKRTDPFTLELTAIDAPYYSGIYGILTMGFSERAFIKEGREYATDGYKVKLAEVVQSGPYRLNFVKRLVFRFERPINSPGNLFLRYDKDRGFKWFEP